MSNNINELVNSETYSVAKASLPAESGTLLAVQICTADIDYTPDS